MREVVPMDPASVEKGGVIVGILSAFGVGLHGVTSMGRIIQKVETHDEQLRTTVHRSEFDLMNEKIDSIGEDVREIRKSLT